MRSKSRRRQSSRPSPANGFGGKRRRKEMRQKVPRRALRAEWTLFRRHGRAPAGQRMMASWFRRLCVKCAAFLSPLYQKDTQRRLSGIVSTTSTTVLLENALSMDSAFSVPYLPQYSPVKCSCRQWEKRTFSHETNCRTHRCRVSRFRRLSPLNVAGCLAIGCNFRIRSS